MNNVNWALVSMLLPCNEQDPLRQLAHALQSVSRIPGVVAVSRSGRSWVLTLRDPQAGALLSAGLLSLGLHADAALVLAYVTASLTESHPARRMTDHLGAILDRNDWAGNEMRGP